MIYSLEGSGLEISRDYDSEQAIQNNLIAKAETYRNQKPSVLYAMYGLAIILAIGSFIVMIYSWKQFGNMRRIALYCSIYFGYNADAFRKRHKSIALHTRTSIIFQARAANCLF